MKISAEQVWNTCGYVRLSREDGDKEESNSVTGQKDLIRDYMTRHPELRECGMKVDDGFTGSNFDRPAFQEMMAEVKAGRINCIVVKDDCVIKARTPQTLENRHFLRIGTEFRAIQRPQRAAYHIETS